MTSGLHHQSSSAGCRNGFVRSCTLAHLRMGCRLAVTALLQFDPRLTSVRKGRVRRAPGTDRIDRRRRVRTCRLSSLSATHLTDRGDSFSSEWTRLRDIIKYKIDKVRPSCYPAGRNIAQRWPLQNVTTFLAEAKPLPPAPPRGAPREPKTPGGLWLPPFPPRTRDVLNQNEPPKAYLTQAEADDLKLAIYAQIHEFEGSVSQSQSASARR